MPSILTSVLLSQMRLARPILSKVTIEEARKYQDFIGELGSKTLFNKVHYEQVPFEGFEADYAIPSHVEKDFVTLYIHGGSYTAGTLPYAKVFGGIIAENLECKTLCIAYRLAPEHPFPQGINDALTAYKRLLKTYPAKKIIIIGESAGGGLTFALCLKLKELNLPLPCCIVGISPWTDLTFTAEALTRNADRDPVLFADTLKFSADMYMNGENPKNPLISPLYGDFTGFPPVLMFAGTAEILEDDTTKMLKALIKHNVNATAYIVDDMWHGFVLYPVPEAKQAIKKIKNFVFEQLKKQKIT